MKRFLLGGLLCLAAAQLTAQRHTQWASPWPYDSIFFYTNHNTGNPLDSILSASQTRELDAEDRLLSRTLHNLTVSRNDTIEHEQFGYDRFGNNSFYRNHSYRGSMPISEWTRVFDSLGVEKQLDFSRFYVADNEGYRTLTIKEALIETVYSFSLTSTGQWDSTWKSIEILNDRGNRISRDNYQYDSTRQEFVLRSRSTYYWDNLGNQVGYRSVTMDQGIEIPTDSIAQTYDQEILTSRKSYFWDASNSTWTLMEHLINQVIEGNNRREYISFEKIGEEQNPTSRVIEQDSANLKIRRLYTWDINCDCWSSHSDYYTYTDEYGRESKSINDNYIWGEKSSRIMKEYQYIGTGQILNYSSSLLIQYRGSIDIHTKSSTVYDLREDLFPENPQTGNELFTIFPNPGKGKFVFMNRTQEPGVVEVIDLQGRIVQRASIVDPVSPIELNGLPSGYYLVRFTQGDQVEIEKYLFQ